MPPKSSGTIGLRPGLATAWLACALGVIWKKVNMWAFERTIMAVLLLVCACVALGCQPINSEDSVSKVSEQDIIACESSSECVLVQYSHCCGASKRGINRRFTSLYETRSEWQTFKEPEVCATIGQCVPDTGLRKSECVDSRCQPAFWR